MDSSIPRTPIIQGRNDNPRHEHVPNASSPTPDQSQSQYLQQQSTTSQILSSTEYRERNSRLVSPNRSSSTIAGIMRTGVSSYIFMPNSSCINSPAGFLNGLHTPGRSPLSTKLPNDLFQLRSPQASVSLYSQSLTSGHDRPDFMARRSATHVEEPPRIPPVNHTPTRPSSARPDLSVRSRCVKLPSAEDSAPIVHLREGDYSYNSNANSFAGRTGTGAARNSWAASRGESPTLQAQVPCDPQNNGDSPDIYRMSVSGTNQIFQSAHPPPSIRLPPTLSSLSREASPADKVAAKLTQTIQRAVQLAHQLKEVSGGRCQFASKREAMALYDALGLYEDTSDAPANSFQSRLRQYNFPPPHMSSLGDMDVLPAEIMEYMLGKVEYARRQRPVSQHRHRPSTQDAPQPPSAPRPSIDEVNPLSGLVGAVPSSSSFCTESSSVILPSTPSARQPVAGAHEITAHRPMRQANCYASLTSTLSNCPSSGSWADKSP